MIPRSGYLDAIRPFMDKKIIKSTYRNEKIGQNNLLQSREELTKKVSEGQFRQTET